jgi:hypothetical protein
VQGAGSRVERKVAALGCAGTQTVSPAAAATTLRQLHAAVQQGYVHHFHLQVDVISGLSTPLYQRSAASAARTPGLSAELLLSTSLALPLPLLLLLLLLLPASSWMPPLVVPVPALPLCARSRLPRGGMPSTGGGIPGKSPLSSVFTTSALLLPSGCAAQAKARFAASLGRLLLGECT